jgi:hypothetical protein
VKVPLDGIHPKDIDIKAQSRAVLVAFMGEKSRRDGHTGTPLLLKDQVSLL